ncbi:hypothetical protein FKW77_008028 [Venturia effusa]|uniref:CFEM domain-containing protein n=1 Tax=Venturia effusa TaxID=50376 RepID=A0A517LLX2_9PEZI|nr:hypothetical protein FKW77_008028 [Venturia effusa]
MKLQLAILSLIVSISAQSVGLSDVPLCAASCAKQIIANKGTCGAADVKCFCELPAIGEMMATNGCIMTSCAGKVKATVDQMNKICGGASASGYPKAAPAGVTRRLSVHGPRE